MFDWKPSEATQGGACTFLGPIANIIILALIHFLKNTLVKMNNVSSSDLYLSTITSVSQRNNIFSSSRYNP
jgi:hypothetical protein